MSYYEFLGYRSEEEFLEDMLGCNEEYFWMTFLILMIQNKAFRNIYGY